MACLQRDPLPATTFEVPLEPMQLEAMVKPTVAMMCTSCIVQDEAMGDHLYGYHHYFCGVEWPSGVPAWQPNSPNSP